MNLIYLNKIDETIITRPDLISDLQSRGFKVHGVIYTAVINLQKGLGCLLWKVLFTLIRHFNGTNLQTFTDTLESKAAVQSERIARCDKGELFRYLLQENVSKKLGIEACIFFDDSKANIDLVKKHNKSNQNKIFLESVHISTDEGYNTEIMSNTINAILAVRTERFNAAKKLPIDAKEGIITAEQDTLKNWRITSDP